LKGLARVQAKGVRLPIAGGRNHFLRIHAAGNKSGALLLTLFNLTIRRVDERFTEGDAGSAVQNAAPPAGLALPNTSMLYSGLTSDGAS